MVKERPLGNLLTSIFSLPFLFGSAFRGSNAVVGAGAGVWDFAGAGLAGAGLAGAGGADATTGFDGAGAGWAEDGFAATALPAEGFAGVGDAVGVPDGDLSGDFSGPATGGVGTVPGG